MVTEFLKSDMIKVEIMRHLQDLKWHSYYEIQTALGMNYNSLKKHLEFLGTLDFVELVIVTPDESRTGKGSYKVKITRKGTEWINRLFR